MRQQPLDGDEAGSDGDGGVWRATLLGWLGGAGSGGLDGSGAAALLVDSLGLEVVVPKARRGGGRVTGFACSSGRHANRVGWWASNAALTTDNR
jgi:hypothetical protein